MSDKPQAVVFRNVRREDGPYDVYLAKGHYWPAVIEITEELLETKDYSPILHLAGDLLSIIVKNGHATYRLTGHADRMTERKDHLFRTRTGVCEQHYLDPNIEVPD